MSNIGETIIADPAVQKVVTDAKADGQLIAADALAFAHSVIGHVSGATPGMLADISGAALAAFYDAVPGPFRGTVQAIVGGIAANAVAPIDALIEKDILGVLGLVTVRIEAWFSPFVPPVTPAAKT